MTHASLVARLRQTGRTFATGNILGMLVLLYAGNALAAADNAVDDGWRRTKDGWENIAHWHLSAAQRELPATVPLTPAAHSPTAALLSSTAHPILLALGIVILGGAALLAGSSNAEPRRVPIHSNSENHEVQILADPAT